VVISLGRTAVADDDYDDAYNYDGDVEDDACENAILKNSFLFLISNLRFSTVYHT